MENKHTCRLMHVGCDIEAFKREHCSEVNVNPDEIIYKIRFIQYGDELRWGKFIGVCYIEERGGQFSLRSTHKSFGHNTEIKIDLIRPGK